MTQPLSVNMTFDTSLVDVQRSFSSTETNTSGSTGKENMDPAAETDKTPRLPGSPFKEVSTDELYEQWASTYDTDGNVLQFVDDLQFPQLLDRLVRTCSEKNDHDLQILDLGCGTGRNTLKLLQTSWDPRQSVSIQAWDSSEAMLNLARDKCAASTSQTKVQFATVDISDPNRIPREHNNSFNALISTLVLEHIPITTYFSLISALLKPNGYAAITNMHSDMGRLSKAGFRTATGERFKATSYMYTPDETVEAAVAAGLEVVGQVAEAEVEAAMIDGGVLESGVKVDRGMVDERARKWVGTTIWYGMVLSKKG